MDAGSDLPIHATRVGKQGPMRDQIREALILGGTQFLSWGICTISWRAVAQANTTASVITDSILSTLNFFLFRRLIKKANDEAVIPWLGYTIGGVIGTITGVKLSLLLLGK